MKITGNKAEQVRIAYVGGGSRGWAWGFMSDLARCEDMCGEVYLYDIDRTAADKNEVIGNKMSELAECKSKWVYKSVHTLDEALTGADFVVISILTAGFDKEIRSDVHLPEEYGIYQSVGDTTGPGGVLRALRTMPEMEKIALAVKKNCPDAWVINYTNPMSLCVKALYNAFPEIKAFGCCHEVFGTQALLQNVVKEMCGITEEITRNDIKVNVVGVNHFTWLTKAQYKNVDIFPIYREFVEKYGETGYDPEDKKPWQTNTFASVERVKMDLFKRYGYIAAAGDRHLAEFCEGSWYLANPETVESWKFALTTVEYRIGDLKKRLERADRLYSGEESLKVRVTGEEGVNQMRALCGICDLVTNVNLPNQGQIPNLPIGAIVETNAVFRSDMVIPVYAGGVPKEIYSLVNRVCAQQELLSDAVVERNIEKAFAVFVNDPLVNLPFDKARELFDRMIENTKDYLGEYSI